MVIVVLQPVYDLSITWVMEDGSFWLGIPWQLMNKWNLVYLAHKVFQLMEKHANIFKGQAKIIQVRFSARVCQDIKAASLSRGFSFERNCVLHWWKSETLK